MADKPNWLYDSIGPFPSGMNSGLLPSQLPHDTLAYMTNGTVRGGYAHPRQPNRRLALDYGGDGVLQERVESGRFQGSAFYRADDGTGSLIASIGGRLFQFTPNGKTATVREITIAHNTIVQVGFAVPAQGATVTIQVLSTVNLAANYEIKIGPYNYIIVSVDSATVLTVENVDDPGPLAAAGAVLTFWDVNPASRTQAWLWQAEKWMIINDGQSVPIFFDGATSRRSILVGVNPELPIARMGTYWMGRVWQAGPDGRTFLAGDAVGGASGTAAYQFRDAVLHVTENTYLASNKVFYVPGNVGDITAIIGVPTLDTSLGQGPVQIYTPQLVFSCNAPTTLADWATVTNPILTVSAQTGASGQYSTVLSNSDVISRPHYGVASLILGRREFQTWGNVPISREVSAVLDRDDPALLAYSTAVIFDNRLLMSASPVFTQHGVYHRGWVALNFDLVSSLRGKSPSVWESVNTGIEILQFVKGLFNGVERCFAFVLYLGEQIQLWEVLPTMTESIDDNDANPITWSLETPGMFKQPDPRNPIYERIEDGFAWVQDVRGRVDFEILWRPIEYPCWQRWTRFSICADRVACTTDPLTGCADIRNVPPQSRTELGFGKPEGACDPIEDRPLTDAKEFQFRIVIQGHCRILSFNFLASKVPPPRFAKPVCTLLE